MKVRGTKRTAQKRKSHGNLVSKNTLHIVNKQNQFIHRPQKGELIIRAGQVNTAIHQYHKANNNTGNIVNLRLSNIIAHTHRKRDKEQE